MESESERERPVAPEASVRSDAEDVGETCQPPRRTTKRTVKQLEDSEMLISPASASRPRKQRQAQGDREHEKVVIAGQPEASCPKDQEIQSLREKLAEQQTNLESMQQQLIASRNLISENLIKVASNEREKTSEHLFKEAKRIGVYVEPLVQGPGQTGSWEGGTEAEEIRAAQKRLRQLRDAETMRKTAAKNRAKPADAEAAENAPGEDEADEGRDVSNHRADYIRREEVSLRDRESRLSIDRKHHRKQRMLSDHEKTSNFRHFNVLQGRYQLLNMLGKGGNGEVYKAFDLKSLSFCAIKIHEIEPRMPEEQRCRFVKCATREIDNHSGLKHPRVVQMFEFFPINATTLATVLELCNGESLDMRLAHGPVPEKEAKAIIIQVLQGLKYLNSNGRQLIHYDLKPANIFYDCGEVKIGDFGLSKLASNSPDGLVDLTQRCGTFCYLPPECLSGGMTQVNSKVDVWSTGIVFFELLYGRKPFGHAQSQESFYHQANIDSTFELSIPSTPKVSAEAKEFLKRLLVRNRDERPDVVDALGDAYFRKK